MKRTRSRVRSGAKGSIRKEITAPRASEAVRYARGITAWGQQGSQLCEAINMRMLRLAALWWSARVAAQEVTPPPGAVLLDLELTVDNTPTRLRLHQDQSFLDAARQACTPTETPEAKDNCVGGAMSIIVNQHLRARNSAQIKVCGAFEGTPVLSPRDLASTAAPSPRKTARVSMVDLHRRRRTARPPTRRRSRRPACRS